MKNTHLILALLCTCLVASCEFGKDIGKQLGFLNSIRKEYGGEFQGSYERECMKITITNSPKVNLDSDSLNYYLENICRQYVSNFDDIETCMVIELKNEQGGFVTSSESTSTVTDLTNTTEFIDFPLEEYFKIRPAIRAIKSAMNDRSQGYANWSNSLLEEELNSPFNQLGMAFVNMANEEEEYAMHFIKELEEMENLPPSILMRLGWFHIHYHKDEKKFTEYTQMAYEADVQNRIYFSNYASALCRFDPEACVEMAQNHHREHPDHWLSLLWEQKAHLELGDSDSACKALKAAFEIKPELNLPDSLISKCNDIDV